MGGIAAGISRQREVSRWIMPSCQYGNCHKKSTPNSIWFHSYAIADDKSSSTCSPCGRYWTGNGCFPQARSLEALSTQLGGSHPPLSPGENHYRRLTEVQALISSNPPSIHAYSGNREAGARGARVIPGDIVGEAEYIGFSPFPLIRGRQIVRRDA